MGLLVVLRLLLGAQVLHLGWLSVEAFYETLDAAGIKALLPPSAECDSDISEQMFRRPPSAFIW